MKKVEFFLPLFHTILRNIVNYTLQIIGMDLQETP